MGSEPPVSMLPREEMLLRPLGRAGEPDTAAGLITAMETPTYSDLIKLYNRKCRNY